MSLEANKDLVKRFLEGPWNYEKLVSLCNVLAPDYVCHGATGETATCRAYRDAVAEELENFSDLFVKVDYVIGEGDRVAARHTATFTPHGEFMGAFPTGRPVKMQSISFHRIANGLIAESWEPYDRRCMMRDLGLEQSLSDGDRAAIRKVIDDALLIGLHDKEAHGQLYYAESAEAVASHGESYRGRKAIIDWLSSFPPIADWKLTNIEIDGAGEMAYVRGTYIMTLSGRAKVPFDKGQYLEVWRKQADDSWKVIRHIFSSQVASRTRTRAGAGALTTHA